MIDIADFLWDAFCTLFNFGGRRGKKGGWTGTVNKIRNTAGFSVSRYGKVVEFRTDRDEDIKLAMTESEAAAYEIGKTYRKLKGEILPVPMEGSESEEV